MNSPLVLVCPEDAALHAGSWIAAAGYASTAAPVRSWEKVYLDTFDARLYRKGWTLCAVREGRRRWLQWQGPEGGGSAMVHRVPLAARDLPDPARSLAQAMGVRTLQPVLHWRGERRELDVRDALDKTVVRVTVETGSIAAGQGPAGAASPAPAVVQLTALKGFDTAAQALATTLEEHQPQVRAADPYTSFARSLGIEPEGHQAESGVTLNRAMTAADGLAALLGASARTVRRNLPGTRSGRDPEFLHDLRVAVRRSRSLLGRLKALVRPEVLDRLSGELRWLGTVTGPVRDLDVYLSLMGDYQSELPADDAAALEVLHEHLSRDRSRARRRLLRELDSDRFAAALRDWEAFAGDTGWASERGRTPLAEAADRALARQFRRVRRYGRAIEPGTEAAALHRLRIECKKLRYLLEAFASLHEGPDAKAVDKVTRALKRLQSNLGRFQDLEVQQQHLRDLAPALAARGAPAATLLAMGRLVERLARKQDEERERFALVWPRFDSRRNRARIRRLAGPGLPRAGQAASGPGGSP